MGGRPPYHVSCSTENRGTEVSGKGAGTEAPKTNAMMEGGGDGLRIHLCNENENKSLRLAIRGMWEPHREVGIFLLGIK